MGGSDSGRASVRARRVCGSVEQEQVVEREAAEEPVDQKRRSSGRRRRRRRRRTQCWVFRSKARSPSFGPTCASGRHSGRQVCLFVCLFFYYFSGSNPSLGRGLIAYGPVRCTTGATTMRWSPSTYLCTSAARRAGRRRPDGRTPACTSTRTMRIQRAASRRSG